jgi:hypothetical protein
MERIGDDSEYEDRVCLCLVVFTMALGEALTWCEGAGLMTRSVLIGMGAAGMAISRQRFAGSKESKFAGGSDQISQSS